VFEYYASSYEARERMRMREREAEMERMARHARAPSRRRSQFARAFGYFAPRRQARRASEA
jgi:hypothetical protein